MDVHSFRLPDDSTQNLYDVCVGRALTERQMKSCADLFTDSLSMNAPPSRSHGLYSHLVAAFYNHSLICWMLISSWGLRGGISVCLSTYILYLNTSDWSGSGPGSVLQRVSLKL